MLTKAYLAHISHYDPKWSVTKKQEEPFASELGVELMEHLNVYGFNTLILDCADGVEYKSHPELRRHYTISQESLSTFIAAARRLGFDLIPKLNFSKSGRNLHDMWMSPHVDLLDWTGSIDRGVYWKVAEDLVNEAILLFRPKQYFHIGMDEDHYRSVNQYAETIIKLDAMIKRRGLRTIIWNDSCYNQPDSPNKHHADKCEAAEHLIPKDIVHVLWEYGKPCAEPLARLKREGFDVWVAPGLSSEKVKDWKRVASANHADGLVITNWIKCSTSNRSALLAAVDKVGPAYAE